MKRTFNTNFLKDELDLPGSAIYEKVYDVSRWSIHYEIVFEYEDKYWRTYYSCGATEQQDESPWEYEKEVECVEVAPKEVVAEKWVEVK